MNLKNRKATLIVDDKNPFQIYKNQSALGGLRMTTRMTVFFSLWAVFFILSALGAGCGDDDDDDSGDGPSACDSFCTLIVECDLAGTQDLTSLEQCLDYCETEVDGATGTCVLAAGNCEDVEACFDSDDDDDTVQDPLCDTGLSCDNVGDTDVKGCQDDGQAPQGAQTGCHEGAGCDENQSCHYTNAEETKSACIENCGECPDGQVCTDLDGEGYLGCLQDNGIPDGAEQQCHQNGGCKGNATCFFLNAGRTRSVCIENCSACEYLGCPEGETCQEGVCELLPCPQRDCEQGEVCWDGNCVPDTGEGPGEGPGPDCVLPPLECEGNEDYCGELIQFDPAEGDGYIDYPENGETWSNQYRSWLRRDVVMLIKYAAAYTACKAENWAFGNGESIGLIDMSEQDGSIPGTSIGQPGHPTGTHTNGVDIDLAYFQTDTSDNRARTVCDHYTWFGADDYHCTEFPPLLDPWRTALFISTLFEHPDLRVVGCDGKVGPMLDYAKNVLCDEGWLSETACNRDKLTYEEQNMGYGWYYFHHHHFHVSFSPPNYPQTKSDSPECIVPGCGIDGRPPRLVPVFPVVFSLDAQSSP